MQKLNRPMNGLPFPIWPEDPATNSSSGTATLVPYFSVTYPDSDSCVLILPGGGYGHLSEQEGEGYAQFFALLGIHAFVLNYRLPRLGHVHPVPLQDAECAIRWIRKNARAWKLNPRKVAAIGSSAGGHLLGTLVTLGGDAERLAKDPLRRYSARPDLAIFCYPVISMAEFSHQGSRKNLAPDADASLLETLSIEKNIRKDTPPCFVWHTLEDASVPVENSLLLVDALRKQGIAFEFHIFSSGRHGLGMRTKHPWELLLKNWLQERGWVPDRLE